MSIESIECPLCMEPMDFDDVDFYPCPCRYQICRFCWDKIINEENGLCPACRKPYNSEHPASYKPRTDEEIKNKIKHSKKVCTKKVKPTLEGKEYLTEYRVLQKNLIFVVGLPMRMADEVELLKGPEFFGRCGKVYKIVINQNQTFPGPQGTPCLSAYVTYNRNEDALKTLVDLKKLEIDSRAVKLSLGTTKYCSQFLRNRRCTKQDCMYLHEMGDQAASFTKDDMSNGKHTEYENQLIQEFFENQKSPPVVNGALVITNPPEQDKLIQRKSSLPSHSGSCTSCIPSSPPSSSISSALKCQRTGYSCQVITPIGTDPNDATKMYSVSSDNCHSKNYVIKSGSDQSTSKDSLSPGHNDLLDMNSHVIGPFLCDSVQSDLPFINLQNTQDNNLSNHSLLDNFYYLNSQVSSNINNNSQSHENIISQQSNNNNSISNYSQYPYKSDIDFSQSFGSDKTSNSEQKSKDTADIDFDPINISRMGLEELIANENRQKMTTYHPQMYSTTHRTNIRSSGPDFNDFYSNNGNLNLGVSSQSYIHDKQSPIDIQTLSISHQISSAMNMIVNSNSTSSTKVTPISSGFPSPPPGFEPAHSNGCILEPPTSEIMNMIICGHNNMEMYNRYQSQHTSSDIPMAMNPHNVNYTNQYSIPSANNYQNEFTGFSNGGSSMMNGYNDQQHIPPLQSSSWKTPQSVFCDSSMSQDVSSGHVGGLTRSSVGYNRSHSMNENTGSRHSEWNGFASYNCSNDSHMNNFHDNFLLSVRGQSAQCAAGTTSLSGGNNDAHIYAHRQQTSHSVNH